MIKYLCVALTSLLLIAGACKKSDSGPDASTDAGKKELLQNKKWQIVSFFIKDSTGHISEDLWPYQEDYRKDDYYIWSSDMTYLNSDNIVLKPVQTSSTIDSGTWTLSNARLNQISDRPGSTMEYLSITSISSGNLTLEAEIDDNESGIVKLIPIP